MARTILRRKRFAVMVKTSSSSTFSQCASVIWQMKLLTCVCTFEKLVKSSF